MKIKIFVIAFMFSYLVFVSTEARSQDAFFYENYEENLASREGVVGFSFDNFSNGGSLNFGNHSADDGLSFNDFDFESDEVFLGSGLVTLTSLALFRMLRKREDE